MVRMSTAVAVAQPMTDRQRWNRILGIATAAAVLFSLVGSAPASAQSTYCYGYPATIVGTSGDDILLGTANRDVIVGLGGRDYVEGRGGNDVICGGDGIDSLHGGSGNDWISGDRDDIERRFTTDDLLICDGDDRAIGIAGVMGGADTEISDATSDSPTTLALPVTIESAVGRATTTCEDCSATTT